MLRPSPVCVYDFTLPEYATFVNNSTARTLTDGDVKTWLSDVAKKWCFQLEVGESGYRHFQGRLSLKVKKRLDTFIREKPWVEIHLSVTSKENSNNDFYACKTETRIAGPWKDTDEPPPYIPRQVREIREWRPWQVSVMMLVQEWDTRTVHLIYDPVGNSGKSILVTYLGATRTAVQIPFCNDYKDILRAVMDRKKRGVYLIDMPRAINKERLHQLYSAIVTVKSGYAYDDRYSFKEEYFDSPNIFVFSTQLPDADLLSRDQWKIWTIDRSTWDLVPYVDEQSVYTDST